MQCFFVKTLITARNQSAQTKRFYCISIENFLQISTEREYKNPSSLKELNLPLKKSVVAD